MALKSSAEKHDPYFEQCVITLDTSSLVAFSKMDEGVTKFNGLLGYYSFLIPTPVMYEFAFGHEAKIHDGEKLFQNRISAIKPEQRVEILHYNVLSRNSIIPKGLLLIVNPSFYEWTSSRNRILSYAQDVNAQMNKIKNKHSFDSLIHSCARNCFTPICTADVKDFKKFNQAGNKNLHDGTVPFFTPEQVLSSIEEDAVFEEN